MLMYLVLWATPWSKVIPTEVLPSSLSRSGNLKMSLAWGTSLVIQWLRLDASHAGGMGSIPGGGTKPICCGHDKNKNNILLKVTQLGVKVRSFWPLEFIYFDATSRKQLACELCGSDWQWDRDESTYPLQRYFVPGMSKVQPPDPQDLLVCWGW